jgi:hypothetical protein
MYRDPYMELRIHEQELRRTMFQNAQEREAREAAAQRAGSSTGPRVRARANRRAALIGPLAAVTRVLGFGRTAV